MKMITISKLHDLNTESDEGKMLLAALAVLTSISPEQINSGEYGGTTNPDQVVEKIADLSNYIFSPKEYEANKIKLKRDDTINNIIG